MEASVHFKAPSPYDGGPRRSICGLESWTMAVTTIAWNVTCAQCKNIDENPEK